MCREEIVRQPGGTGSSPGVWAAVGHFMANQGCPDLNERASQVQFLYIIFLISWSLKATIVEFRSAAYKSEKHALLRREEGRKEGEREGMREKERKKRENHPCLILSEARDQRQNHPVWKIFRVRLSGTMGRYRRRPILRGRMTVWLSLSEYVRHCSLCQASCTHSVDTTHEGVPTQRAPGLEICQVPPFSLLTFTGRPDSTRIPL